MMSFVEVLCEGPVYSSVSGGPVPISAQEPLYS